MIDRTEAINEIVTKYFDEPNKSVEEIFGEYLADLPQEDAEKMLGILKEIIN